MDMLGNAVGLCRCRCTTSLLLAASVLFVVSTVTFVPVNAEANVTPLCAEKHGFASEFNDHFLIPVEKAPATGEAVILIARAYPLALGSVLAQWLYLNATYRIPEGAQITKASDNNGLLEIPTVAAGTDIEVRVVRVRPDGPVPFRFLSFLANNPICHLAVTPGNLFFAPVPRRLAAAPQPFLTAYFKTVLPPRVNGISVRVDVDDHRNETFISGDKVYTSGDIVPASPGGTVFFSYTFSADNINTQLGLTTVSVSYVDAEGGETQQPSTPSAPNNSNNSNGTVQPTPAPSTSQPTSVLRRLLAIFLILFLAYQVVVSVYNYHILGKRDLMDIIPCSAFVAAGVRMIKLLITRGMGATQRRTEGYEALQSLDDPYA